MRHEPYKLGGDNNYWYTGRDSNPQPSEPESDALSIEPPVHLCLQPSYYNPSFSICKGGKRKILRRNIRPLLPLFFIFGCGIMIKKLQFSGLFICRGGQ